jgi:tetratricopeptide (TPR) repeat protein
VKVRAVLLPTLMTTLLVVAGVAPASPIGAAPQAAADALRSGRYVEGVDALEAALRGGGLAADEVRLLVDSLIEVGRTADAEEVARRWADGDSTAALAARHGRALAALGRSADARRAFLRAIDADASDALDARLWLAELDFSTGRRDEAMRAFDTFIDVYNRAASLSARELTLVGIACTYLGVEDADLFHDAVRAFDEAIAADPGDPEPRLRLAELFLDKYQSGEAAALLDEVATVNPNHPRALLAQARRQHFDGDGDAMATVDRALEVNPRLDAALAFRGRLLLQAEQYEAAMGMAATALDANPMSVAARAVRAAAEYLSGDGSAFRATVDGALSINPRAGELFHFVAEMAVQNRLYADAVELAQRGVEVDPTSWASWGTLGINQLRVGEIEAGTQSLERAFAGDPFNVWFKNTLDLIDTYPGYDTVQTEHFDLFIERDIADALSLHMGPLAEEAWATLTAKYQYAPPYRVRVEVYRRHADFSVRTVGLAGLGALGVAFGPVLAVDAPAAAGMGEFNWGSTLWHEIAHVITLGATDNRIPRWLTEGLSVYEERRARTGWGEEATPSFLLAHLRGQLLPVSSINDGFVRPAYPEQISHSYFQASLVCELVERDYGFDALLALLEFYRAGGDTPTAIQTVLGIEQEAFDEMFVAYLEDRYAKPLAALQPAADEAPTADDGHGVLSGLIGPQSADPLARADEAPGDYLAQLAAGASLAQAGRLAEAEPYLERAVELFPDHAAAGGPYLPLAEAYAQRGATEAAIGRLRAMLARNESHAPAYERLADLLEQQGRPEEAAAVLDAIAWIDPFRMPLHRHSAELWESAGVWDRALMARRSVLALDPVDRAEALYRVAVAYRGVGDLRQARRTVLRALELAPGYPEAQALLLALRAARQEGVR